MTERFCPGAGSTGILGAAICKAWSLVVRFDLLQPGILRNIDILTMFSYVFNRKMILDFKKLGTFCVHSRMLVNLW